MPSRYLELRCRRTKADPQNRRRAGRNLARNQEDLQNHRAANRADQNQGDHSHQGDSQNHRAVGQADHSRQGDRNHREVPAALAVNRHLDPILHHPEDHNHRHIHASHLASREHTGNRQMGVSLLAPWATKKRLRATSCHEDNDSCY